MKALITRKIGMTSTIAKDGRVEPVTLLFVGPTLVTQIKTIEKDGYTAVQMGTLEDKSAAKPQAGHTKPAGKSLKVLKEFRTTDTTSEIDELKVSDELNVSVFEIGDTVHATGISKGKGWAGTIKRHNFHRGRKTHGGGSYRRPGSIGSMYPQKIFKGKRMAGQMGAEQVTIRNLRIALIDVEQNIIGVVGAIPGPRKGLVTIRGAK